MIELIKKILKALRFDKLYYYFTTLYSNRIAYIKWLKNAKEGNPPQLYKQIFIKKIAKKYGIKTLIETGTFLGDTVNASKKYFNHIYTIELDNKLHQQAVHRFKRYSHISCLLGDSSKVLPEILNNINEPCLFWLDGHFSGGITAKGELNTPVNKELETIFSHQVKEHVILIDDARLFTGENDYPQIHELKSIVVEKWNCNFQVENDIILIIR